MESLFLLLKKLENNFMHFVISLFTATKIDPKIIKKIKMKTHPTLFVSIQHKDGMME